MRRECDPSIHSIEETRRDRTNESLHSRVHIVRGDFMQLKLQRSQRSGGAFGTVIIFCLDARAEYSPAEAANIGKYKLGGQSVYNSQAARKHLEQAGTHLDRTQSGGTGERAIGLARGIASFALAKMHLNISIASLGRGHRIECKDLSELLEAESALMEACRNLREFLQVAASFNGSIILVDFDNNESVQVATGTLELSAAPSAGATGGVQTPSGTASASMEQTFRDIGRGVRAVYDRHTKACQIGAAIVAGLLFVWFFTAGPWTLLIAALMVGGAVVWTRHA